MKKVLVIGCPGAGKTTFCRKLAAQTGLPIIHLDYYYNDKKFNYENDKPAWRSKVLDLLKGQEWIVDGNYSSSFPERFKMADAIFFFDYPLRTRLYGVFKRRWEFRNKKRKDMPDGWEEKISWLFFWEVVNFRRIYWHKITNVINQKTSKKVITFKNRRDTRQYLETLKQRMR